MPLLIPMPATLQVKKKQETHTHIYIHTRALAQTHIVTLFKFVLWATYLGSGYIVMVTVRGINTLPFRPLAENLWTSRQPNSTTPFLPSPILSCATLDNTLYVVTQGTDQKKRCNVPETLFFVDG